MLLYHSTPGLRVIKKKKMVVRNGGAAWSPGVVRRFLEKEKKGKGTE